MKRIVKWFAESNRYKHLTGGFILGLISDSYYCATLVGATVGAAMEFKDKSHGTVWDWIDCTLTLAGSLAGFTLKHLLFRQP